MSKDTMIIDPKTIIPQEEQPMLDDVTALSQQPVEQKQSKLKGVASPPALDDPGTDKEPEASQINPLGDLPEPAPALEYHEYANWFPMLDETSESAFNDFVEDIKNNGLTEKITTLNGKILDGRNRYKALQILGWDISQHCEKYEGADPLGFVMTKNLRRQHLNESQRAMIAAKLANMQHGGNRKNQPANLPLDNLPPITQAEAAAKLNVSERSVGDAKAVLDSGDKENIEAVESGKKAVSAAASEVRASKKEVQRKTKPVTQIPDHVSYHCMHDKPVDSELVPKALEAVKKINAPTRDILKLTRMIHKEQEAIAQKILAGEVTTVTEAISAVLSQLSDNELKQWNRLANKEGKSITDIALERHIRKLNLLHSEYQADLYKKEFCTQQFRSIGEVSQMIMAAMAKLYTSLLDTFGWEDSWGKSMQNVLLNCEIERSRVYTAQLETLRDAFISDATTSIPDGSSDNSLNNGNSDDASKDDAEKKASGTKVNPQGGETYSQFWNALRQRMNEEPDSPFRDQVRQTKRHYTWCEGSLYGFTYCFSIPPGETLCRVELWTRNDCKAFLKEHIDKLQHRRDAIESALEMEGTKLAWYPSSDKKRHVDCSLLDVDVTNKNDWDKMIRFFVESILRLEAALEDALKA